VDWWIVKQLRAKLLEDLRDFIPQSYFEIETEKFKIDDSIKNSTHYSSEMRWGYLAGRLGQKLFFKSNAIMSVRQTSASEVLMNLGMLATAEAAKGSTKQLSKYAEEIGVPDGNAGNVAEQLEKQQIPTLSNNVIGALEQYLRYLTPLEAKPFTPLLSKNKVLSREALKKIVLEILKQFQDQVENKGQWKQLWNNEKPREESDAQRLFYVIAYNYCKANNIDLTPEPNAGNGPVDFKLSQGFNSKIVVELKLSTNGRLVHGYEKQLEIYKQADDTNEAFLLLIDIGKLGRKYEQILKVKELFLEKHGRASDIWLVNGKRKASASKRES